MEKSKRILVTGATGFLGSALVKCLVTKPHYNVAAAIRNKEVSITSDYESISVGNIEKNTVWTEALSGVDVVIHTAARVHVMSETSLNPLEEFRRINTEGTLNLAKQAAKSGIKRFIYISSIKVNGEITLPGSPFTANDIFVPPDPYALSKYEAEQGLLSLAKETKMNVVIIRPPLVYGPKVKANFLSMMKWLYKNIPLPFGAIHNKRSLVALDNLVDLVITCIEHPSAANEVFLVSDDEDLSTSELLKKVSNAEGKRAWLLPVNQKVLEFCLGLIGKKDLAQRLCASLQVDISKTKKLLNWTPPVSVDEALTKTVEYFLQTKP